MFVDSLVRYPVTVRTQLDDRQWAKLERIIESQRGRGRRGRDDRNFLEAVLWIHRTGAPWRDLPDAFGSWKTVYNRFTGLVIAHLTARRPAQFALDLHLLRGWSACDNSRALRFHALALAKCGFVGYCSIQCESSLGVGCTGCQVQYVGFSSVRG